MKFSLLVLLTFFFSNTLCAQRDLTPGKSRKSVFGGARDFKEYRSMGLQFSIGPTFMLTRKAAALNSFMDGNRPFALQTTPNGLPGFFVEAGMTHFPKKRSRLSEKLNYIFVSYIDWGIGFKLFQGKESTNIDALDLASGSVLGSQNINGKFNNGFLSTRVTFHKNIYIGKKYFIDNGLGVNADFNIMRSPEENQYSLDVLNFGLPQRFHPPFVAQLHYELGFGIRLNRRSMLIPSVQTPILNFYEWRGAKASLHWFDSNYQPLLVKLKWTYLFEKKVKGCAPARVNDQDQDTMKNK
jgi:hypothetical protein